MNVVNSYQPKRLMNKTKSEKQRILFLKTHNKFNYCFFKTCFNIYFSSLFYFRNLICFCLLTLFFFYVVLFLIGLHPDRHLM